MRLLSAGLIISTSSRPPYDAAHREAIGSLTRVGVKGTCQVCDATRVERTGHDQIHRRRLLTAEFRLLQLGWSLAARGTKINSSYPPLTAVCTAYPTEPFPPLLHPPIELASFRPHGRLHLDRRIDFPTICFGMLTRTEIPHV